MNPRALRLVSRALIAETGQFTVAAELVEAMAHIATELSLIGRRAEGEPIVRVRLRLGLPPEQSGGELFDVLPAAETDDGDPGAARDWPLSLELVDGDDRGRWCAAAPRRRRRARSPSRSPTRNVSCPCCSAGCRKPPSRSPAPCPSSLTGCPPRSTRRPPASTSMPPRPRWRASRRWPSVGVELLAPEKLTRRRPSTRAHRVSPRTAAGSGRFAATALVDWQVVVDDTPGAGRRAAPGRGGRRQPHRGRRPVGAARPRRGARGRWPTCRSIAPSTAR
ncbi:MAG: hypothetical protein V9H26_08145 [Verrucomicrobiota bacterium]